MPLGGAPPGPLPFRPARPAPRGAGLLLTAAQTPLPPGPSLEGPPIGEGECIVPMLGAGAGAGASLAAGARLAADFFLAAFFAFFATTRFFFFAAAFLAFFLVFLVFDFRFFAMIDLPIVTSLGTKASAAGEGDSAPVTFRAVTSPPRR